MKMFTADQAWAAAEPIIEKKENERESQVKAILERVKEAANRGKTWLRIDEEISGYPYRRLKELGYDVDSYSDQDDSYYSVSWFGK